MKLAVLILTFNEELNLPACLESVVPLRCPVYVVDSGSTDGTRAIAEKFEAGIFEHAFESHARQWAWALEHLPLEADWVLALDADQRLTPELAAEIARLAAGGTGDVAGYYLNRRQVFRGQWIRHGGYYPKYLLKLFRRDCVFFDPGDLVDHHFYVRGATRNLRHDLIEANLKENDLTFWIEKHNRYSTLLAREELMRSEQRPGSPLSPSATGNPDQRTLLLKQIWRRMPRLTRSCLYFGYRYFLRGGWMDGREGFIFHFLQGFWFRLLIDIKLQDMIAPVSNSSQSISSGPALASRRNS